VYKEKSYLDENVFLFYFAYIYSPDIIVTGKKGGRRKKTTHTHKIND
jgi:hypothetical protein